VIRGGVRALRSSTYDGIASVHDLIAELRTVSNRYPELGHRGGFVREGVFTSTHASAETARLSKAQLMK